MELVLDGVLLDGTFDEYRWRGGVLVGTVACVGEGHHVVTWPYSDKTFACAPCWQL